ncbi:hypothetical protein JL193_15215 [Polaribacter batillariae]|uniref:Uncharacterized protein n=1 Tax=Polaribacter batillariae TaxID=2808900 RepID=A0ABX7STE1_9FLAO|nr:hypothetical protein [Polaribacter batillariae]QTD37421.1 hypothetical protein JL193_15215 [Polaribacter batillariae]
MKSKKLINVIYSLNVGWYFVTLFLFITIYFGLLAEIVLGFIQVLSSFLILFYCRSLSAEQKKRIYFYWSIIVLYFSLWLFNWDFLNEWILFMVCIGLIPMVIGCFFIRILKSIKNQDEIN